MLCLSDTKTNGINLSLELRDCCHVHTSGAYYTYLLSEKHTQITATYMSARIEATGVHLDAYRPIRIVTSNHGNGRTVCNNMDPWVQALAKVLIKLLFFT